MKEDAVEAACLRAALATDQLRGADALETARGHALDEIVASEETYVANMRICLEVFRDPLRDLLGRDEVLGRVLNELEMLEKFQATFLGELRSERARDECFGAVFRRFAPFFKMTATYAEAYGAWSRRAASDGNNRGSPVKDVMLVLARQAFDARCKGRDLAQFLVAPVQRVPRYRLLLEALVLRTNEDHAGRNDLDEALTLVRDACAKIDAILGEHAVRNEMQLLKSQIHDPSNQLSSLVAHRLVRMGDARKLSTSKIETLTFWLTDRALFSCDRPPATNMYRLRFYAPLTRCVVEAAPFATLSNRCDRAASEQLELAAAEDPRLARIQDALRAERAGTRCLVVRSPRKSFYVELASEDEARGWLDDVAAHQETPPSLDFAPVAADAPRKRGWLSPRRSRPDVYDFSPRGSEASALSPRGSYDLGSDDDGPSWAPTSPPPPPRPRSLLAAARSASASRPPPLPPRSGSVVVEPPPAPPSPPAPPDQPPLTTESTSCFVACAPAPAPPEPAPAPASESSPEPATVGVFGRRAGAPAPVPPAARDTMFTSIAERLRRFEGLGR